MSVLYHAKTMSFLFPIHPNNVAVFSPNDQAFEFVKSQLKTKLYASRLLRPLLELVALVIAYFSIPPFFDGYTINEGTAAAALLVFFLGVLRRTSIMDPLLPEASNDDLAAKIDDLQEALLVRAQAGAENGVGVGDGAGGGAGDMAVDGATGAGVGGGTGSGAGVAAGGGGDTDEDDEGDGGDGGHADNDDGDGDVLGGEEQGENDIAPSRSGNGSGEDHEDAHEEDAEFPISDAPANSYSNFYTASDAAASSETSNWETW